MPNKAHRKKRSFWIEMRVYAGLSLARSTGLTQTKGRLQWCEPQISFNTSIRKASRSWAL